eukprot:2360291-Amphidinium_carterae.1
MAIGDSDSMMPLAFRIVRRGGATPLGLAENLLYTRAAIAQLAADRFCAKSHDIAGKAWRKSAHHAPSAWCTSGNVAADVSM